MNNKSLLCALSVAATLAAATAARAEACDPGHAAAKYPSLAGKTIRIGLDPQTPPYAQRDAANGEVLTGSDVDLTKAVFACEGIKIELTPGAWSGLLPAVVSGQIDVMPYLYFNPKRAEQVDFVLYQKAGTGALVAKGNPKNIKSNDDLCGKGVAVLQASVEEALAHEVTAACVKAGHDAVQIMTYSDDASGFRLLQNGRTDVVLNDLAFIDATAKKQSEVFERAYAIISGLQIGFAGKKGNEDLIKAIFDGLKSVQAEGGQNAILKKYGIDPTLALAAEIKQ
jgi:polar amino acid transport system substrate-binding protein